jgi:hypothetical protein
MLTLLKKSEYLKTLEKFIKGGGENVRGYSICRNKIGVKRQKSKKSEPIILKR